MQIKQIGVIKTLGHTYSIVLDKDYIPALISIDGFSHLLIIWWGHLYESPEYRTNLIGDKPYTKGPEKIGVFATRSPVRPNPILITTIIVQDIDHEKGIIYTPYIDAENESPVLDIKPYHQSERVKACNVPEWCKHWPEWHEDSAAFDWENEFNF